MRQQFFYDAFTREPLWSILCIDGIRDMERKVPPLESPISTAPSPQQQRIEENSIDGGRDVLGEHADGRGVGVTGMNMGGMRVGGMGGITIDGRGYAVQGGVNGTQNICGISDFENANSNVNQLLSSTTNNNTNSQQQNQQRNVSAIELNELDNAMEHMQRGYRARSRNTMNTLNILSTNELGGGGYAGGVSSTNNAMNMGDNQTYGAKAGGGDDLNFAQGFSPGITNMAPMQGIPQSMAAGHMCDGMRNDNSWMLEENRSPPGPSVFDFLQLNLP